MAEFKDIITDENGDLIILNGDFKVNESDSQHVEHIVIADKGQFRQFPLIGVGIKKTINGSVNPQRVKQQIKLQLESDGFNVRQIEVNPNDPLNIQIDAERKNK
jgi:hypothetical protein